MGEKPGLLISAAIHSRSTVAAQQLIAGIDALACERISRIALVAVVTVFPLLRIAAPDHFP
ncbi:MULTISPECIES: hypothetical protein [unclassified Burkholderia]|uniref:hypothetical protein n=1 Tax=unclassified Burkholderia TaxID=2613784 RepID=UPI000F569F9D|nr:MULTISPECIES: hypothetical protein [unclassified Burkholderia]